MLGPHGRLPVGYVLARAESREQHAALDLTLTAEAGPKWAKVLQTHIGDGLAGLNPVEVNVGDRILVKPYCAHDVELVLPDTPQEMRCERCNAREADPDAPPACIRNPEPGGAWGPHQYAPKATPEALLIVNLADVLYCELA